MAVILLVDDNEDNREIFCAFLEHRGHTCHLAESGIIAVRMAQALIPDLILLDITMPLMTGWEAMEILRGAETTAAIPVVALSAHVFEGDEALAQSLGFVRYLRKPIEPRTVVDIVEQILT